MSEVVNILEKLIAFPTVCETPNEDLINYVADYLTPLGFRVKKLPGEYPHRLSLIASIGPESDDGIVFSAHSDVVPVQGQPWTTDPFVLTQRDGKLLGRGTSDMKGFLACMLVAAKTAASRKAELKSPIHFAVSYDEEIGCVGCRSLLSYLKENKFAARGCVIGEPTLMDLVIGHKGKMAVKVNTTGLSAHSSNPFRGTNAILLATKVIEEIELLQARMIADPKLQDSTFEVPHSTAQIGVINGGIAVNIVPDSCEFKFEMRLLAGANGEEYVHQLQQKADEIAKTFKNGGSVKIEIINNYPGLNTPESDEFVKSLLNGKNKTARINFGTEGGLFQEFLNGIPVVVCGPGSIDRAHKADEWITSEELDEGVEFLKNVISTL